MGNPEHIYRNSKGFRDLGPEVEQQIRTCDEGQFFHKLALGVEKRYNQRRLLVDVVGRECATLPEMFEVTAINTSGHENMGNNVTRT